MAASPAGSSVLIGIDWGGTKIEGVALEASGRELMRILQPLAHWHNAHKK